MFQGLATKKSIPILKPSKLNPRRPMPLLKGLFAFALLCPVFYHSSLSCSQFLTWSGFLSLGMICCYLLVLAVPFLHLLKTQFLEKHVWRKTYSLVSLLGLLSYLPRTNLLTYVLAQLLNSFCFALPYLGLPCLTLLCPILIAFWSCWILTFSPFSHFLRNLYISCSKFVIGKIKVLDSCESFTRAICKIFSLFRIFTSPKPPHFFCEFLRHWLFCPWNSVPSLQSFVSWHIQLDAI